MWSKFLNVLGFETKAQKAERERVHLEMLRAARQAQAQRRLKEGNRKVNGGNDNWKKKPTKTSSQVRAEHYGIPRDEDYLTPGFNSYYDPTVFMPAVVLPTLEPHVAPSCDPTPSSSYDGGSSSYDYNSSSSSSYDSGSSSSYDSGSSSCDSGGGW